MEGFIPFVAPAAAVLALLFAVLQARKVNKRPDGSEHMRSIAQDIRNGAYAFLRAEYKVLAIFIVILFVAIGLGLGNWITAIAFVGGAIFSVLAGFFGMKMATAANVRTAEGARRKGMNEALTVAFAGGAVMGMSVVGLGLVGVSVIYLITGNTDVLFGFSLGASSIALFSRVGGGIYTKAADMGADLVGKFENGIPEDDPRNPATIADNVGDNVGDVAGMGADLFESYVGSLVSAITLGVAISAEKGVWFPLTLTALGILGSITGCFFVRSGENANPHKALKTGSYVASIVVAAAAVLLSLYFFDDLKSAWAVIAGLIVGLAIGSITEIYTSSDYKSVKRIALQSETGTATNIVTGVSTGMLSTAIPIVLVCVGIYVAYICSGMYGIALAAVGMLSTTGLTVAVDAYGPIADNAGGIAQMAGLDESVRKITDKLDAVGNTTAAMGKGFAIGSAALTALALFVSYAQEVNLLHINDLDPYVIIGLFLGGMLPFLFSALTMNSVSRAAHSMIGEVRRQFTTRPGILRGEEKPDYTACVSISSIAALKEMVLPGVIAVLAPIATGLLLGTEALGGLLVGSVVTGVLLAIFMSNSGGAWDNAKKYIEEGYHGGKGSEAHKASVVGDTVGDPFKDTSGPAINILIKLMAVVSLVFAPLFVQFGGLLV